MITFIQGKLVGKMEDSPRGAFFIVNVHGIGYEVLSSSRSVASSAPVGDEITLFTSLIVREDAMFLIGFNSKEERDLFNILQNASGVGVKMSLSLLSALSVSEIAQAVVSENFKPLTVAKGVGNKLAQKIVLDLKEKMAAWREMAIHTLEMGGETTAPLMTNGAFIEAETVLLSLGYTKEEVIKSFQAIQPQFSGAEPSSETVLKESLGWLAKV